MYAYVIIFREEVILVKNSEKVGNKSSILRLLVDILCSKRFEVV